MYVRIHMYVVWQPRQTLCIVKLIHTVEPLLKIRHKGKCPWLEVHVLFLFSEGEMHTDFVNLRPCRCVLIRDIHTYYMSLFLEASFMRGLTLRYIRMYVYL